MSNTKFIPGMKGQDRSFQPLQTPILAPVLWPDPASGHPNDSNNQTLRLPVKPATGMPLVRLSRVIDFVDANIALDLCVSSLAAVAGMSSFYFCRSFKQSTGITPHRYVLYRKMEHAKRLLASKEISLLHVAQQVGFTDQSQFTRVFHKIVGVTPAQYRKLPKLP
jgi:AraC-like DNA-binding protein